MASTEIGIHHPQSLDLRTGSFAGRSSLRSYSLGLTTPLPSLTGIRSTGSTTPTKVPHCAGANEVGLPTCAGGGPLPRAAGLLGKLNTQDQGSIGREQGRTWSADRGPVRATGAKRARHIETYPPVHRTWGQPRFLGDRRVCHAALAQFLSLLRRVFC